MGALSNVFSPSHPISYSPINDNAGKIKLLPTAKELLDLDLVLLVNTKEPIESLLPACYVEKHEGTFGWLVGWLFVCLFVCLFVWLVVCLFVCLVGWLVGCLVVGYFFFVL
jgi:uncharacterized membrane protein AbrB (regulator of aidB expression)